MGRVGTKTKRSTRPSNCNGSRRILDGLQGSKSYDDEGSEVSHSLGGGEEVYPEGSKDSHDGDGREQVPPSTARYGKGMLPYTKEDKGKHKQ